LKFLQVHMVCRFFSKAGSHLDEGAGAAPGGSSSVSVGELWLGIDQLDEVGPEGTSAVLVQDQRRNPPLHSRAGPQGLRELDEVSSRANQGISGSSSTLPCGCGGDSEKNKVARILVDASRAISPQMRHPFVDRQYSPSTGMDRSK
jgi:hypothetical protein